MQTFRDEDDSGYISWIENHPDGFVVNAHRKPIASYLRLHRATCFTISKDTFRGKILDRSRFHEGLRTGLG